MSQPELIDHDHNFKELISTFFMEFLELFLPEIAKTIDPNSIIFLEQEYLVDLVEGEKKIIDLLARVTRLGGKTHFLIHFEAQATSRAEFNRRILLILHDCMSNIFMMFFRSLFFRLMSLIVLRRIRIR